MFDSVILGLREFIEILSKNILQSLCLTILGACKTEAVVLCKSCVLGNVINQIALSQYSMSFENPFPC